MRDASPSPACDAASGSPSPRLCPQVRDPSLPDHRVDELAGEVVVEVPPVGRIEQHEIRPKADGDPAAVVEAEDMRSVDRGRGENLLRRQAELGAREGPDDGKALAEGAAR